jgi:hypothetical protein
MTQPTRAEINRNPGNIRPAKGVQYEGLLGVDDAGFGIFESPEAGRKALEQDIRAKLKKGYDTPESFINRYTPKADENDEQGRLNYKIYLMDQAGLDDTHSKFDDKHVAKIANAITAFEKGGWKFGTPAEHPEYAGPIEPDQPIVKPPVMPPPAPPSSDGGGGGGGNEVPNLNPAIGAIVGAPLGAAAGASAASYKAHIDAAEAAYNYAQAQRAAKASADAAKVAPVVQAAERSAPAIIESTSLTPNEAQHTRAFEGTDKGKGVTGRASQTTYQLRTQQMAEEARKRLAIIERLKKLGIVTGEIPGLQGNIASTPAGIATTTEAMQSLAPAAESVAPAAEGALPAAQKASFWKYLRGLGALPAKAALGGAGAGFGAIDALNRFNNKDTTGGGISTAGTLAGLAAPYVATMGALPAASIAAPLYLTASDRIKHLQKHPEDIRLQEDEYDAMGNRIR